MGPQGCATSTQVPLCRGHPAVVQVAKEALHGGGCGWCLSHPWRGGWMEAQVDRSGSPQGRGEEEHSQLCPLPFHQALQETPPPQPGSPRPKLPISQSWILSFCLCVGKISPLHPPAWHPPAAPAANWLREFQLVMFFPMKSRKTKLPSQVAPFL